MELRKDYILDRWVIISEKRAQRPKEFKRPEAKESGTCYFCPGSESCTPPEIGRVGGRDWRIRWFPNKFPAVDLEGSPKIILGDGHLVHSDAFGYHEIIVETPDHDKQLAFLPVSWIRDILKIYSQRMDELSRKQGIRYVSVFKNSGPKAGTSLIHTHTQIIAYNRIPGLVEDEMKASIRRGNCAYCDILKSESASQRRIYESRSFVSFAPYASRFNYEAWLFPKDHIRSITELDGRRLLELAGMLKRILAKLESIGASYNFCLHYAPKGKDLHFHIEVTPRISTWAGFEISSDDIINVVSPEAAARFYRGR